MLPDVSSFLSLEISAPAAFFFEFMLTCWMSGSLFKLLGNGVFTAAAYDTMGLRGIRLRDLAVCDCVTVCGGLATLTALCVGL